MGTVQVPVAEFYESARPLIEETIATAEDLLAKYSGEFEALYLTGGGSELPLCGCRRVHLPVRRRAARPPRKPSTGTLPFATDRGWPIAGLGDVSYRRRAGIQPMDWQTGSRLDTGSAVRH